MQNPGGAVPPESPRPQMSKNQDVEKKRHGSYVNSEPSHEAASVLPLQLALILKACTPLDQVFKLDRTLLRRRHPPKKKKKSKDPRK